MRKFRRSLRKFILVVITIVIVPTSIITFSLRNNDFNEFTKKTVVLCAKLAFWGSYTPEPEIITENYVVDYNDTKEVVSQGSVWALDAAPEETQDVVPESEVILKNIPSQRELAKAKPYPKSIENRSGPIKTMRFKKYKGSNIINLEKGGQVRNCTSVNINSLIEESKLLPEFNISLNDDAPQVLIMHTHTTESFEPYTRDFYDASFNSRSTDETKNIVAVGNAMAAELKNAGISIIHDKTIHDYPRYNGSYQRSEITVKNILKQYPSIKVVLDVHRDAIQNKNGVRSSPVVEIGGKRAAQIMIVSGCDDETMDMPNYMKNFRLASLFQQQIESDNAGLTRPILFDYRNYNQHLTTGSLLFEIGAHSNSIDEVIYSGELVGKSLAAALKQIS